MDRNRITYKILTTGIIGALGIISARKIMRHQRINSYVLHDRVALITGGTRGLGLILTRKLAAEDAMVAFCARNQEELDSVSKELSENNRKFMAINCDVTDAEQVNRMINEIEKNWGPVEIVINNAGIINTGPSENMTREDYSSALKVHFWGPFYIINRVLPEMKQKKEGRIVNIVSVGGLVSFPHLLPYNVSKFALSGYSEGLTAETVKNGVKITTVYPGFMNTGSPRNIGVKGDYLNEYVWFSAAASMPGIAMDAEKAAEKIMRAMCAGEKTLILSISAKTGNVAHAIFPGFLISLFGLINRFLPGPIYGHESRKAHDIAQETAFNERASQAETEFNQD